MRLKPTHLREAVQVLTEGQFESAEEAAKAVIATVDELRAKDTTYAVVRQYNSQVSGPMYMGYGGFPTFAAAQKAIETGRVGLAGYGAVAVVPMKSTEAVDAKFKDIDDLSDHVGATQWARFKEQIA